MKKTFRVLGKAAVKSAASYRLILTMWFSTLAMVLLVALPLRASLRSVFGYSLATDRLLDGFDLGLVADMGPAFRNIVTSLMSGSLLLVLLGFLLFTFFAGGLFTRFTSAYHEFRLSYFFKACAGHFFSYLIVGVIMTLIIIIWGLLIIGIPVGVTVSLSGGSPDPLLVRLFILLWGLGLPVWLLVADHARRWHASTGSRKAFRALGQGFRSLGRAFLVSYVSVLTILVINILFMGTVLWFTATAMPQKGWIIFLFTLATQVIFLVRLFLKAWRYAAVTELALL